jgi:hypothetical protein
MREVGLWRRTIQKQSGKDGDAAKPDSSVRYGADSTDSTVWYRVG